MWFGKKKKRYTYDIKCFRSPLAEEGSCNSRNALRGRDVATRGVGQKIVWNRHVDAVLCRFNGFYEGSKNLDNKSSARGLG